LKFADELIRKTNYEFHQPIFVKVMKESTAERYAGTTGQCSIVLQTAANHTNRSQITGKN